MSAYYLNRLVLVSLYIMMSTLSPIYAVVLIKGNGTTPFSFNQSIISKTFDPATGTLYVGLASGGSTNAISKISSSATLPPQFTGIALSTTSPSLSGSPIPFLSLATFEGNTMPLLAAVKGTPLTDESVFALSTDGKTIKESSNLRDANAAFTSGIAGLAAKNDFIFASVAPNGGIFGDIDSGIAVVSINRDNTPSTALTSLTQTAAQAGDPAVKAKLLDPTSPEVFIGNQGTIGTANALYWDDPLHRLYIGISPTANNNANDGARAVVVGRVNQTNPADYGTLDLSEIAPTSAITNTTTATQSEIIVGRHSDAPPAVFLSWITRHLRVLHASTGPSYLITSVSNRTIDNVGTVLTEESNKIFALPLVDLTNAQGHISPDTPTNQALQGTLAKKDAPLTNFKFTVPATSPGDLVSDPTINPLSLDTFALVGGSPLPIDADRFPSDIVVVGDTVYVSFDSSQTDTNETGILYSQALFDQDGTIRSWTPWAKRGFPLIAFPNNTNLSRVKFFSVDAATGNLFAIGGDNAQTVTSNAWDRGDDPASLTAQLNTTFNNGSYSVLDLDAFTRGFNGTTSYRYALFGGPCRVAFALISQGRDGLFSSGPQIVTIDFANEENFFVSDLPQPGGCVTALEYSRRGTPAVDNTFTDLPNYFFAGTARGLFVFANPDGTGFDQSSLGLLNTPPFSTGQWVKAPNIQGSIVDVKTIGNSLYVLTFITSKEEPLKNILYKIDFAGTVDAMFATPTIIAQTNVDIFENIFSFASIQIVSTDTNNQTEQLALATNNGLFVSSTVGGVQTATDQTTAGWALISDTDETMYVTIAGIDPFFNPEFDTPRQTQNPITIWPLNIISRSCLQCLQDVNSINQLNGTADAGPFTFIPTPFNAQLNTPVFNAFLPTTQFWTDGTRRFFITSDAYGQFPGSHLMSIPYNVVAWDIANPNQQILSDSTLNTASVFYWVKQIGASGILMAGTNNGVISLE